MTLTRDEPIKRSHDLRFWLSLLSLNLLLFLPLFLLNIESYRFWPLIDVNSTPPWWKQLFHYRQNLDIFRLNVEFALLITLWVLIGVIRLPVVGLVFSGWYLLTLYYYIYEAISLSFFLADPILYNQYFMAVDGLQFLFGHIKLSPFLVIGTAVVFVAAHWIVLSLIRFLFDHRSTGYLSRPTKIGLVLLSSLMIASVLRYEMALANPVMVASSVIYKLKKNVQESLEIYENVHNFDPESVRQHYDFEHFRMKEKPDIYLLFIESYGSVLYKRSHFRSQYVTLLSELEQTLADSGWQSASNLSTAPTWGGGSWMSYASLLFGLRIDSHPQFLFLRNRYRYDSYPDIAHYLKSQGYRYFRLSSLSVELTEHEWEQYINFYGVDVWPRYRDMNYQGQRFSWGPSPPDQVALGFMHDYMGQHEYAAEPKLMFFITQNSHYPWKPLPPIVDDWRRFGKETFVAPSPAADLRGIDAQRRNYLASIEYELRTVVDFILRLRDENTIVVVVGDHQPPRVARRSDGFETPIHIISKDSSVASHLSDYGFQSGMIVTNQSTPIKHEGFYSMFIRVLLESYGEHPTSLPPYLPEGLQLAPPKAHARNHASVVQ